mmetsp:Transcript_1490/g.4308  ORF Transcript_1490/g.4308 Transcript_1490/m.4308 type:complete len:406 (+) Transcript_1490:48-1265(+)
MASGNEQEGEWTYVAGKGGKSNRGADKRSAGRRRTRTAQNKEAQSSSSSRAASSSTSSNFAGGAFYSTSATAGIENTRQHGDSEATFHLTDEQSHNIKAGVQQNITRIMKELERHPYVVRLLETLTTSSTDNDDDKNDATNISGKAYEEIICYGIGNFLPSSVAVDGSYALLRYPSAPMLQLALALVIRRYLANLDSNKDLEDGKNGQDGSEKDCDNDGNWYSKQQGVVRMLFFEPLMTDLERTILEDGLCVDIIETNERGKRQANCNGCRTLFYMPHCPMRLYGNVLWANWDGSLWNGGVVIYGNNFHGYDDRILSKEERADPTNAVLKIIPHLNAKQIDGLTIKSSSGVESDLLVKMENAFNDCVVTTFDAAQKKSSGDDEGDGPERPEEYVFDDEEGDGEVV